MGAACVRFSFVFGPCQINAKFSYYANFSVFPVQIRFGIFVFLEKEEEGVHTGSWGGDDEVEDGKASLL